jgi:hypothetical protein
MLGGHLTDHGQTRYHLTSHGQCPQEDIMGLDFCRRARQNKFSCLR